MKVSFGEIRKAVTAAVGVAAEALDAGLVHGTAAKVVGAVIAIATVLGVYAVPNRVPAPVKTAAPAATKTG